MPVQYSHIIGPLVGLKRENFDVYWFIGPLGILRQVLTFDLTNKMLMRVTKNVVLSSLKSLNGYAPDVLYWVISFFVPKNREQGEKLMHRA